MAGRRPLALATLVVPLLVGPAARPVGAAEPVKRGDTLPVYLPPPLLAEAERPGVDPAAGGGGFWNPGPERFYGWALRDLRDYLQRMTGARFPLTAADARAGRGIRPSGSGADVRS